MSTVGLVTKGPPFCSSEHVCFCIAEIRGFKSPKIEAHIYFGNFQNPPNRKNTDKYSSPIKDSTRPVDKIGMESLEAFRNKQK